MPDNNNNIWIGLHNKGIAKYDGKNWTFYSKEDVLFNCNKFSPNFFVDKRGDIWFGTWKGISMYDGQKWSYFKLRGIGSREVVYSDFLEDDNGKIYFSGAGLGCYDGKDIKVYRKRDGMNGNLTYSLE